MSLLSFENVTKHIPAGREQIRVLEGVSFAIEDGDVLAVHGGRRSGKSTLLQIAAGWEPPDAGTVRFDGRDLWKLSEHERAKLRRRGGVGLVVGDWRPSNNRLALQHVEEALACDGPSLREARLAAHRALERVGLAHCAHVASGMLSRGELVRLGLAERLVHAPRLLLIDEPTALSRPSEATELYDLMRSLAREGDLALVIASEELAPVRFATRVFSLDGGRVREIERGRGRLLAFPGARATTQRP